MPLSLYTVLDAEVTASNKTGVCICGAYVLMEGKRQVNYVVCRMVINAMEKGRMEDINI